MKFVAAPLVAIFLNYLLTPGFQRVHGSAVSLLFENDGNWEDLDNRASALLFYDPETLEIASQICQRFNETLFKDENLPDVQDKLFYLKYKGEFDEHTKFWVVSSSTDRISAIAPFTSEPSTSGVDTSQKFPFLCSNSAPLTSQVDTDFSSLPKTNVISNGTVFTGVRDHLTFRFMGVPYASPPTGSLRFQYPEQWNGTYVNATGFQPACLQFGSFANNEEGLNPWGISEDCLFLNIYTSYIPSSSQPVPLRPVLFWIHGGGNLNGMGSDETFDGGPLVSRGDVVVVTINYRLNIFGFLGLNDSAIPGNYAMADKIFALRWVKEHIADFGGDPDKVTIFGQSAGGWSIVDLLKSPKATGLFHAAISQSGGSGTFTTAEAVYETVEPFLSPLCHLNVTGAELLKCLQVLPADILLNITNFASSWSTVIDGIYALDSAVNQMALGPDAVNSVPFMLGFMPEEGQSLLGNTILPNATDFNQSLINAVGSTLAEDVLQSGLWTINEFHVYNATINVYTDWFLTCPAENMITAASNSNAFPAIYVYSMQHAYGLSFYDPYHLCTFPVGNPQPYYRCHSGDLYEVFGTYHIFSEPLRIPADISYTNLVQDLWANFARMGDPNPDLADLEARGPAYESTLRLLKETKWVWPVYDNESMQMASLEYPELMTVRGLPDDLNKKCVVITAGSEK
ncbi:alpha/beta-hydrolase [Lentinula aciculospora]|uniref:Carboxylic ester hydrolase n=1 Tax=Lentinula aciculospora TaxID=153920 RepID=A0A9W9DGZ4_9AGAR|nr:alpha/beta-hydrolase [Lentinula aciculospora]